MGEDNPTGTNTASDQIDLGGINVSADQLSEFLSIYIREIESSSGGREQRRIRPSEFATHVINPKGIITGRGGDTMRKEA